MKTFKIILYWFLVAIALIQFIPVHRINQPVDPKVDFVHVFSTPLKIQSIIKTSCYDCHSDTTVYPDYAYVAPISWMIKNHVREGREHLNFSQWGNYNRDLKRSMLQNSVKSITHYSMPLPAYISKHPKANLTAAERILLENYFETILESENY